MPHVDHPFETCDGWECSAAHERDEAALVKRVTDLWNEGGGWIPGAAYAQLADALSIDPSRLTHYDPATGRPVGPPEHQHRAGLSVLDGAAAHGQCIIWVDDVRCTEDVRVR